MTTLYEAGKEECKTLQVLSEKDTRNELKRTIKEYFEKQKEINNYYMLLCRENNDYTVFNISHFNDKAQKKLTDALCECMLNRGGVFGAAVTIDNVAMEIWIKYDEDGEPHCYYFFPYDIGVIKL